jgi:hypothetical protein
MIGSRPSFYTPWRVKGRRKVRRVLKENDMNKTIARILALGVAVALPTGLIAQTTPAPKPADKPAATSDMKSSSSSTTTSKDGATKTTKKKSSKKKKTAKKSTETKKDETKTETKQ